MRTGITLLSLIVLLLLVAVFPVPGGRSAEAVYYSPVFMLLLALLAASCAWCCLRRRLRAREAGFWLTHFAVVVILAGALAGFLFGVKGYLRLAVQTGQYTDELQVDEENSEPLGFEVGAEDFTVEFYPPHYQLYLPLPPEEVEPGQMPYEPAGEYATAGTREWDLGAQGSFAVSNLWNEAREEWEPRYPVPGGGVLGMTKQTPSFFGVTLLIRDDGRELKRPISINHPASYGGWRFYLMSYDSRNRAYVDILARRDPGRNWVISGIWMLIAGVFILSFRRTKEAQNGSD